MRLAPDGASVLVRLSNPLTQDLCGMSDRVHTQWTLNGANLPTAAVDTVFMDKIMSTVSAASAGAGSSGKGGGVGSGSETNRWGKYRYDEHAHPRGGKKTLGNQLHIAGTGAGAGAGAVVADRDRLFDEFLHAVNVKFRESTGAGIGM